MCCPDPPSVASTIGKAAIVILVTFSIPLQVHPCRASLDAVLKWRPNKNLLSPNAAGRPSPSGNQPLLPSTNNSSARDNHGAPTSTLSDLRFALLTTVILVLSYITALNVSSLDRVLAYVGSTGSTSISFILPGLFYYKISDPNSIHHQRLLKADDDADLVHPEGEDDPEPSGPALLDGSVASIHSTTGSAVGVSPRPFWRGRRKWRWDLEHIETGLLRRLSLCLAIYGLVVMGVCLVMNIFMVVKE